MKMTSNKNMSPGEFRRQVEVVRVVVGHEVLVSLLLGLDGHVVVEDGRVHVHEEAGVYGHK